MAASYPGSIKPFTTRKNVTDIIQDYHVNDIQLEIIAIETTLGVNAATSSGSTAAFIATSYPFTNISARIANVEAGVSGDTHTQYVKKVGGSTITPSAVGTVGLSISAMSGQTADLQQWKNSAGTVVTRIDSSGSLKIGSTVVAADNDVQNLNVMSMFDQL